MTWITTTSLDPSSLSPNEKLWVYNALDASITAEVFQALEPKMSDYAKGVYIFSRAMQSPVLTMMRRGIKVDLQARAEFVDRNKKLLEKLEHRLNRLAYEIWGKPLNPRSPKQLKEFFYKTLNIPPQYAIVAKRRTISTGREALEKVALYFSAKIFVSHILKIREIGKLISDISSAVDADERMRTTINIAGTETGRVSSSSSAFATGGNLQNKTEEIRRVFVADKGKKLAYIDLEQAESRLVALLAAGITGKDAYLRACESGDLHTQVSKLVWPDLAWTGNLREDKAIAEQPYYRHFSYRDMAKRGGHGTNYYGTPATMAKHLKLETEIMVNFQRAYFDAFPEIREFHLDRARRIQLDRRIVTILGRERHFFGRRYDDATLREAIAFEPQSVIGDHLNLTLLDVYNSGLPVEILLQVHDAILIQYDEDKEEEIIPAVIEIMSRRTLSSGRFEIKIPVEAQTGWNWSKFDPDKRTFEDTNPFGLKKWKGKDERVFKETSLLDRRFY